MINSDPKNIFRHKSAADKHKELIESTRQLNIVGEIARKCLTLQEFETYRREYEEAERKVLDDLIDYTQLYIQNPNGDVVKYAFTVVRLLTRLQDYRSLLKKVTNNAARKAQVAEEKTDG